MGIENEGQPTLEQASAYIFELVRGREPHPEELDIITAAALYAVENGFDFERTGDTYQALQEIATKYGLDALPPAGV